MPSFSPVFLPVEIANLVQPLFMRPVLASVRDESYLLARTSGDNRLYPFPVVRFTKEVIRSHASPFRGLRGLGS
jgi:hypothetical protein